MIQDKQKLLIEYLISSVDTFALCTRIIKPGYFDPELRSSVSFIQNYYNDYHTIPDADQIAAETGVRFNKKQIEHDKIAYCAAEIESFCKRRAIEKAIVIAPKLIQEGDYGSVEEIIKEAITISLHRDTGLDIFEDPYSILMRLKNEDASSSTGWLDLDEELGGGIRRKEMIIFSANSGGGKSLVMANLALNFLERGLNVLYISLELFQDMVAKRYFGMMSGYSQVEVLPNANNVAHIINEKRDTYGKMLIKRLFAGSNCNDIKSLLKEIELKHNYIPDVLVVDYLDLMSPNGNYSNLGTFEKDKMTSEQLRDLGEEYNMYIITASQQNRGAVEATEINHSHIAGGISKINTTDILISIIWNDQMKAEGIIKFFLLKTRSSDGVGHYVTLKFHKSLRITDLEKEKEMVLKKKTNPLNNPTDSSIDGSDLLNFLK